VVKNLNFYQEEDLYFKDEIECKCNECLGINPVILYREINYESNKTIELENETLETFSNGISPKKRKLNNFELNSELESDFEKRIEDNLKKFQKWARFMKNFINFKIKDPSGQNRFFFIFQNEIIF